MGESGRTRLGEEPSREGCQKGHYRKKGKKMMKSSVLDFLARAAAGGNPGSRPER